MDWMCIRERARENTQRLGAEGRRNEYHVAQLVVIAAGEGTRTRDVDLMRRSERDGGRGVRAVGGVHSQTGDREKHSRRRKRRDAVGECSRERLARFGGIDAPVKFQLAIGYIGGVWLLYFECDKRHGGSFR